MADHGRHLPPQPIVSHRLPRLESALSAENSSYQSRCDLFLTGERISGPSGPDPGRRRFEEFLTVVDGHMGMVEVFYAILYRAIKHGWTAAQIEEASEKRLKTLSDNDRMRFLEAQESLTSWLVEHEQFVFGGRYRPLPAAGP